MLPVMFIFVLLCWSIAEANIVFARNAEIANSSFDYSEEFKGPFITVGDESDGEGDNTENLSNSNRNVTVAYYEDQDEYNDQHDPDDPDEGYDDYDTNVSHLHVRRDEMENIGEEHSGNFPKSRKKKPKCPKRPKKPKKPKRKVKRPIRGKKKNKKRVKLHKVNRVFPYQLLPTNNCAPCRCGVQNTDHISGGQQADPSEFPWIVHLSYFGRFYCAGVLINDRYIVTAGHCTRGFVNNMITVRLLDHARSQRFENPYVTRRVESVFRPPSYNPQTLEDDISLLRITPSVPLDRVTPICLPIRGYSYAGRNAVVAGWGIRNQNSEDSSDVLRKAVVPILTNSQCRRTSVGDAISNRMLCAGNIRTGGNNACEGDSGGPLMIRQGKRYRLIGVVSWGAGCGQRNSPGIYTRVSKYLNWIRESTQDACSCL